MMRTPAIAALALLAAPAGAAEPPSGAGPQQLDVQSWHWGARAEGHSMLGASDRQPLLLKGRFPGCTKGARYAAAQFAASGKRYDLSDVVVTECSDDGMTVRARKVTVKGWNPETKEL